jgi:hypothetical protein
VWTPPDPPDTGYCANQFQLRNALVIVFCTLTLAIPAWLVVYWRVKRRIVVAEAAEVTFPDAVSMSSERNLIRDDSAINGDEGS